MTDRKKPSAAFWATAIVVVGLVAYPLSFGPVSWIISRVPQWSEPWRVANFVYAPILRAWWHDGKISAAIGWYANWGSAARLIAHDSDGTIYLCITGDSP